MKLRLFLNYYQDPSPERQKELEYCLNMNQNNPLIDKIYVLAENHVPGTTTISFTQRPTFNDFFEHVNSVVAPDDITIISNTDIYFGQSLELLYNMYSGNAYTISRHDLNRLDSQDAWIFKGQIRKVDAPFQMGIPGCDNALAQRLHAAGYNVSNPCYDIKGIHVHKSQVRNYDENTPKAPKPYMLVAPCHIGQQSQLHLIQ